MDILGIDFTSRPSRRKPITCLPCRLEGNELHAGQLEEWPDFASFESALKRPGPWIAGFDFPFGQSRTFIENIGWPATWQGYVEYAGSLERGAFREALDGYRENRPAGSKEHRRRTDVAAGSISPQKLYGVPVGLMFFEGAPRLLSSGVTIPGLHQGDPERIAVEAYPGVLARQFLGRRSYKNDTKGKQTGEQHRARRDLFAEIVSGRLRERYGIIVHAEPTLCDDPGADHLDALLCAIQAAWAWRNRDSTFGAPKDLDQLEGWIADPSLSDES